MKKLALVNLVFWTLLRKQCIDKIQPGIWEIGRVREYDWFQQMSRQVMD